MIENQKKVAQVVEMIHTASLVHDDVIDLAKSRRNKSSANVVWGQKKVKQPNISSLLLKLYSFLLSQSIVAGDFVFGRAIEICAGMQNDRVFELITKVRIKLAHLQKVNWESHSFN